MAMERLVVEAITEAEVIARLGPHEINTRNDQHETIVSSIDGVEFAGTRHYPPSWVGATSCRTSGFWVNRSGKRFAMELKTERRGGVQTPLRCLREHRAVNGRATNDTNAAPPTPASGRRTCPPRIGQRDSVGAATVQLSLQTEPNACCWSRRPSACQRWGRVLLADKSWRTSLLAPHWRARRPFVVALAWRAAPDRLAQARYREPIKCASPEVERLHAAKNATPTMGGLFIVGGMAGRARSSLIGAIRICRSPWCWPWRCACWAPSTTW